MTTNKDLRRRETDKFGEWFQKAAFDDELDSLTADLKIANARIAELEAIIAEPLIHAIFAGNGNIIQWDYVDRVLGSGFIENTSAKYGRPITALAVVPFNSIVANNGYGSPPAAAKEGE